MLRLAPFRSENPLCCVSDRDGESGGTRTAGPVLRCRSVQPASLSLPSLSSSALPNSWRKGKTAEGFAENYATHIEIGKPPFPDRKSRGREGNLCLCVSRAMRSWVPAWISCYFSPEFTLKEMQHSFLFLPSEVLIYMKLSSVMTFNISNATFIVLLCLLVLL